MTQEFTHLFPAPINTGFQVLFRVGEWKKGRKEEGSEGGDMGYKVQINRWKGSIVFQDSH